MNEWLLELALILRSPDDDTWYGVFYFVILFCSSLFSAVMGWYLSHEMWLVKNIGRTESEVSTCSAVRDLRPALTCMFN